MLLGAGLALAGSFGLGSAITRHNDVVWPVRLCVGAGVLSGLIFLLMTAGLAQRPILASLCVVCTFLVLFRPPQIAKRRIPVWAAVLFGIYSVLYLAHAAGPEIQSDPNTYHLTPARDALRYGGFSNEIGFYDRLPHALELLFVVAYGFGGPPAAKLVHLAFLFATAPLIVRIGRRLDLPDASAYGAAGLYFMAPVTGVTGSAAFNDAALVCATLAMVLVLLEDGPPWLAGLLAGFCYALKLTGGLAIPVGMLMLASKRRWRGLLVFGVAASALVLPWMIRNAVQTGNPVAPFFNRWFPNPYFHVATEERLSSGLRTYGVPMPHRIGEVLWGTRLQGMIGPVFLLAPIALLSLRTRAGVVLVCLAVVFSLSWWMNAGARFLLLSVPFLALAMCAAAPRAIVFLLVSIQAVTAWPHVMDLYSPAGFRLGSHLPALTDSADYRLVKWVESLTAPDDRIFDMYGLHAAHVDRKFTGPWQTAEGEMLMRALELGSAWLHQMQATIPEQSVTALRVRQTARSDEMWSINEVELTGPVNRTRWSLEAEPNRWETPLAFDRNYATRWMTHQRSRPGQHITVDLEGIEPLSGVRILSASPLNSVVLEVNDGNGWRRVQAVVDVTGPFDLRRDAVSKMRARGFRYIVARAGEDGSGQLGRNLALNAEQWGVEPAGQMGSVYLLRIR